MKRFILVLLLAGLSFSAFSQKVYFLYLQTEPAQPFFVKMNGKVHSSSVSGYMILSRLMDSTYTLTVGFNRQGIQEQVFTVKMGAKDHGFLLKDFGEKGWGLFDLQQLSVQYSESAVIKPVVIQTEPAKDVSPFTDLLAKATGDPSLRDKPPAPKVEEKPVLKPEVTATPAPQVLPAQPVVADETKVAVVTPVVEKEKAAIEKKPETPPVKIEAVAVKADPVLVNKEEQKREPAPPAKEPEIRIAAVIDTIQKKPEVVEPAKAEVKEPEVQIKPTPKEVPPLNETDNGTTAIKRSVVTKRSESSTTEGFGLVFMDTWEGGRIDTIRLLIPNPKQVVALIKETPKQDMKFLDIQASAGKPAEKTPVVEEKPKQTEPGNPSTNVKVEEKPVVPADKPADKPVATGTCADTATEADFFALRKSMAASEGDDEMIIQAKKYFKQKCFTAAQLKNLSALFLNDEAKYNFFDAAYKYTTDKAAFATLESELKDPYFINRFKAIIR